VATWNIAAINNNPFEYWITHDDADYNALMEGVQSFIDQPGERDLDPTPTPNPNPNPNPYPNQASATCRSRRSSRRRPNPNPNP